MARILVISSEVSRGYVGATAARFALQQLGHDVWVLPTILLSNHPGHPNTAGTQVDPVLLARMLEALAANGWLGEVDAVLTGYLPSAAHVGFAAAAIEQVKRLRPDATIVCDTVIGDDPKGLYVEATAALAVRYQLLPLADVITPNRFELTWLSGEPVTDAGATVSFAAQRLACPVVVVTSVAADAAERLANVLITPGRHSVATVMRVSRAPHGTGDLLAAILTGERAAGRDMTAAFQRAVAIVDHVVRASAGHAELQLPAARLGWETLAEWPLQDYVARPAA